MRASSRSMAGTERHNPRWRKLDQLGTGDLLNLINREDKLVPHAVERELGAISRAVDCIVEAIQHGGRLIYVGAGTSGRLAALDAAECPPTFGISPRLIQAVIAGGRRALTSAAEGAEDSASQGAKDLSAKGLRATDVVVGVTASGGTPYVLGALRLARKRGAQTIAVTANRNSAASRIARITIAPDTGPEVIAGSTRMKAGTAQKLILNMLTTAAMIRLGHVYNNWMVDLNMTNEKLRSRGLRILQEATGASEAKARRALAASGNLRVALVMLQTGLAVREATRRLKENAGDLRLAISARHADPGNTARATNAARRKK